MCDVCLEIIYPRNFWRSWFINQRYSLVPTRLPTINSLMSNPTVAPPGFSPSSHHLILQVYSEDAECWDQHVNSAYGSSVSVGETLLAAVETQRCCLDPTGLSSTWTLMLLHTAEPHLWIMTFFKEIFREVVWALIGTMLRLLLCISVTVSGDEDVEHDVNFCENYIFHTRAVKWNWRAVVQIWAKVLSGINSSTLL